MMAASGALEVSMSAVLPLRLCCVFVAFAAILPLAAQTGTTAGELPALLENVGIEQRLGEKLPLNALVRDEQGREVALGSYFGDKPVILALVYYECPMLCSMELKGLVRSIRILSLDVATDFEIVTLSFDPGESAALAAKAKQEYVQSYGRPGAGEGWHFLTADEENIRKLTEAAGFAYRYLPETDDYSHASGVMIVTPDGTLSQYFYGVDYAPRDLRLALVEASEGRIGSIVDQILLFCFHYDPAMGRYTLVVMNVIRALGLITVLAIVGFLWFSLRRERKARPASLAHGAQL
jgi:protein SCO1/2